jgi:hypothetical protein
MSAAIKLRYFLIDRPDGTVEIRGTLPRGTKIRKPLKAFDLSGSSIPAVPLNKPLTSEEFDALKDKLGKMGFKVRVSEVT